MKRESSRGFFSQSVAGAFALGLVLSLLTPTLYAQYDDQYDPFADFSEFEDDEKQRKDIEFFESGRLLTVGFLGGYRGWSGNNAQIFEGAPAFGLFLTYFFDLRFGLQVSFATGDHPTLIPPGRDPGYPASPGNTSLTSLNFDLKYYFNTQNVTKGLAVLNPYLIGGFSQNYRTTTLMGEDAFNKETAFGANVGGGIEIPIMEGALFFGLQGLYRLVSFPDEGSELQNGNGPEGSEKSSTGVIVGGDLFEVFGVLGVNF